MKTVYLPINILKALGLVAAITALALITKPTLIQFTGFPASGPRPTLTPRGLDIAVSRSGKNWLSEANEDRQGSIVKTFDPEAPAKFDNDLDATPNQKIRIKLSWTSAALATLASATLEEGRFYPSPDNAGILRIYDGQKIIKSETTRSVSLINRRNSAQNHLAKWNGSIELLVEARRTGTTLLSFKTVSTTGETKIDKVRITGIINDPYKGRILFVNLDATPDYSQTPPTFDDYLDNASPTLAEAIAAAPVGSNIVVGPGTYQEHGIEVSKPVLLTGLGGNYDSAVDTTMFNLEQAPVIDSGEQGRVLRVKDMTRGGTFTMSGLRLRGGMSDDGSGAVDISCGEFS